MKHDRCVLHICCDYSGTELYRCFMEAAHQLGRSHRAYVPVRDESLVGQFPSTSVEVVYRHILTPWDRIFYRYKIRKIARDIGDSAVFKEVGLVHAHTLFSDGGAAYLLKRATNVPYAVSVRNVDVNAFLRFKPYLLPFALRVLNEAERVVLMSKGYREALFKRVPVSMRARLHEKTIILPNGVDKFWLDHPPAADRLAPRKPALRVLYAGHINRNKNPLATASACETLCAKFPKLEFRIAGPIHDQRVGQELGRFPFVKMLGKLDKRTLLDEYRNADVFCMPSFTETFGLVYLEAMSQGLPVIYTRGQGFDGHFPDGEVGVPVDPRSPPDIASALLRIAGEHERMSCNAIRGVGAYAWSHVAEIAEREIYEPILGGSGRRQS